MSSTSSLHKPRIFCFQHFWKLPLSAEISCSISSKREQILKYFAEAECVYFLYFFVYLFNNFVKLSEKGFTSVFYVFVLEGHICSSNGLIIELMQFPF